MEQRELKARDGTPLAYRLGGPLDGTPIVLCHGLAAGGEQFGADAEYFAARGYRVLVPDLRGHGRSGKPHPVTTAGFAIPVMAADLLDMLDHARLDRVHWVGNSLGGILALDMLKAHAHRFRSLTTFGTAYRLDLPALAEHGLPLAYAALGPGLLSEITARSTTADKAGQAIVKRLIASFDPAAGRAISANVRRYDLIAAAQDYAGPILLIRGGKDNAVNLALPRTLNAMAGRPNFRRLDIPEGGHCANLDAPHKFRAALEGFWSAA